MTADASPRSQSTGRSPRIDAITAAGEVIWVGVDPIGERDGRIALYLADRLAQLLPPRPPARSDTLDERERAILDALRTRGASFFAPLHEAVGGGYPGDMRYLSRNLYGEEF